MPKLTQVKETKRGRYALFFDGEFAFSLDEDTFAMAGLHTGDELEEWQIHDLQTKSDTRKAVDKAMDLGLLDKGDITVITAGLPLGIPGTTNMIKVQVVGYKY